MSDEVMQQTSQKFTQAMFVLPQVMTLKAQLKAKKAEKLENQMAKERFSVCERFFEGKAFVFTGTDADLCFFYAEKAMPVSCIRDIKDDNLRRSVLATMERLQADGLVEIRSAGGQDAVFLTKKGHDYIMPPNGAEFWQFAKDMQNYYRSMSTAETVTAEETVFYPMSVSKPSHIVNIVGENSNKINLAEVCKNMDDVTANRFLYQVYMASKEGLIDVDSEGNATLTDKGKSYFEFRDKSNCVVEESYRVGTKPSNEQLVHNGASEVLSDEYLSQWSAWRNEIATSGSKIVRIPEWVTEIPPCGFYGSDVEMVFVPENVERIGVGAFYDCTNLKAVSLPDSLKSIEDAAFTNTGIEEITIPQNTDYIGNDVFVECSNLKRVSVPDKHNIISEGCFKNCNSSLSITRTAAQNTVKTAAMNNVVDGVLASAPTGVSQGVVIAKKLATCVLSNTIQKNLSNANVPILTLDEKS